MSVIVPMYNVARWLPDFLSSLDALEGGLEDFEILFVDDGSPDDSAAIASAWIERSGAEARLISKPNGGLASARNLGMESAKGEWVTFWDPDDMVTPVFAQDVRNFLATPDAADVALIVARLVWYEDESGKLTPHPLDRRFSKGSRVVDLEVEPDCIHLAANTAFYRKSVLLAHGIEFDARVVPTFEDGHLTGRYLATFPAPRIALRADAKYLYRRRSDQSSLVQTAWAKEAKYLAQPRYGWLDMLERVQAQRGEVPRWIQEVVVYELQWYFRADQTVPVRTSWISADVAKQFLEILAQVVEYIDDDVFTSFRYAIGWNLVRDLRAVVLLGLKGRPAEACTPTLDKPRPRRGVMRLTYNYSGVAPTETFYSGGQAVVPRHAKVRSLSFFGQQFAYERVVWFPLNARLSMELDGRAVPIESPGTRAAAAAEARAAAGIKPTRRSLRSRLPKTRKALKRRVVARGGKALAAAPGVRTRFADAWLLLDKDTHAQDNAEHLYRYLKAEQPQVNAWFVLDRSSPDWDRLSAEGFRMIPHGSKLHRLAILNARHIASSHADHYVVAPLSRRWFPQQDWRFTFLQHGVTKDDLSTWLNGKPIDLVVAATREETEAFHADGNGYRFTDFEVALTGFPRHDRLWRLSNEVAGEERKALLFMPTWRVDLLGDRVSQGNQRQLRDDFWQTSYARSWRAVLESDRLREAAEAGGYSINFIPHPNMQEYLADAPLPPHVVVRRFNDLDVGQTLASGAMLVTDYSSLAFEAAYLQRPVVYYQFDAESFFSGSHVYTRGYWDYTADGFGPVCPDAEGTVDAILAALAAGCAPASPYAERMASAFPFRDGQCCARTYAAIAALDAPIEPDALYTR